MIRRSKKRNFSKLLTNLTLGESGLPRAFFAHLLRSLEGGCSEFFEAAEVMFIGRSCRFSRLGFSIALMLFCLLHTNNVFEVMDQFRINLSGVKLFKKYISRPLP